MIKKIKIKFSSSPNKPPLETELSPITVFVGPNNSGKSKVLMEIERFCRTGRQNMANVILVDLDFNELIDPEGEINNHTLAPIGNEYLPESHIFFGKENTRKQVSRSQLLSVLSKISANKPMYCDYYVSFNTIRIDGQSRINLVQQQHAGDLKSHPVNSLQVLFKDNSKRMELRRIIYDAFKKYFVIDPTELGQFRIRLSDTAPLNDIQERGIHENAIEFHKSALDISQTSDGVKAFTGIMTTIIAGDPKVILIDEPEAFLHPSLASNLGKEISRSVNSGFKNLFASTHSANFLMGCIHSGTPLNIIRLTYSNNVPTARILESDKILKLMRHPLLRSTGVLNGLFYEYVVVTEADADRAFYQEINERLLTFDPKRGIPNCLFLNAQNLHTIHALVKPLREMGIPSAAIVDVDVVKNGGASWSHLLKSSFIPDVSISAMNTSRTNIKAKFEAKPEVNFKTQGGVDVLEPADKEACNNLFDQMDEYGIFAVRNGELESWLKALGTTATHTPEWLIEIFEKLGEDPSSPTFVMPTEGDVWDFLFKIKTWFSNPSRKGIP